MKNALNGISVGIFPGLRVQEAVIHVITTNLVIHVITTNLWNSLCA